MVAHTDRGSQYVSVRYTERLDQAGIAAPVGAAGDSYANALTETINALYKTEIIKPRGPRRTADEVGVRHRRMDRLVQPSTPVPVLRRHPTGRSRRPQLR